MNTRRVLPILIPALELFILFGIALLIRVVPPFNHVFTTNGIAFTGNDAYYHMRLVEGLVNNFPHFPNVDPYLLFGSLFHVIPSFFQWLLGIVSWIFGAGSPSPHLLNVLGVWYPPILGALTVIPAYFIGRELWGRHGRWAGIVAAALVALLPGEFLGRSILGFTDQHAIETLLSTTAILFLIMAIKSARVREIKFLDYRKLDWSRILRPTIYAILCGIFLGLYIFAWQGALLLVFVFAAFFIVQFVIDHLKSKPTAYLATMGVVIFLISLIFLTVAPSNLYAPSLLIGLLIPAVLWALSRIMINRHLNRLFYPLAIIVGGGIGIGLFYLINPGLLRSMFAAFNIFTPSGTLLATIEAQSILTPISGGSGFLDTPAWINFYFALPVAFIGLVILVIQVFSKQGNAERVAFIIWSLVMIVATIGQRRFAYYLVVNVALLAGYTSMLGYYIISWLLSYTGGDRSRLLTRQIFELEGLTEKPAPAAVAVKSASSKKARRREQQIARRREMERRRMTREQARNVKLVRDSVGIVLTVIVVFMLLFSPILVFPDKAHGLDQPPSIATASSAPYAPSGAWMKSLAWMKDNTPDPLGSSEAYYEHYASSFSYPESAYGVMAWWDYGYWITYIGHRIPIANPGQDQTAVTKVANFLLAQDEAAAEAVASDTRTGYVIMDYQTATSKFWAVATWAGKDQTDFFEIYWDPDAGQQKLYIYPAYYQSMSTRLYSFNGTAQQGLKPLVVEYVERTTSEGSYKEVVSENPFNTYEEAEAFLSSQTSGNFTLVGGLAPGTYSSDPLVSPVPLEALQHYKPIYGSDSKVAISSSNQTPEILIFERTH